MSTGEFGLDHFDRYQFENFYTNYDNANTKIDYTDYQRSMSTHRHRSFAAAQFVPPFATDMAKLRAVLKECERLALPSLAVVSAESDALRRSVANAGGSYLAMIAAVAYRAWLLHFDSVEIADEMDMKPEQVRRYLRKMREVARKMGFEAGPHHKMYGHKYTERERRAKLRKRQETIRRRLFGKPEYDETFHCWRCRIKAINKAASKWFCDNCRESHNRESLASYRRTRAKHGRAKYGTPEYFAKMRAGQRARARRAA
jgi:transcription initiation factor IIE alpha subunit